MYFVHCSSLSPLFFLFLSLFLSFPFFFCFFSFRAWLRVPSFQTGRGRVRRNFYGCLTIRRAFPSGAPSGYRSWRNSWFRGLVASVLLNLERRDEWCTRVCIAPGLLFNCCPSSLLVIDIYRRPGDLIDEITAHSADTWWKFNFRRIVIQNGITKPVHRYDIIDSFRFADEKSETDFVSVWNEIFKLHFISQIETRSEEIKFSTDVIIVEIILLRVY